MSSNRCTMIHRCVSLYGWSLFVVAPTLGATSGSRLDPGDFTSLGSLNLSSGTIQFDTDALTVDGFDDGVVALSESGLTEIAVFTFDSITLEGTVDVVISGSRPIALLSQGDITVDAQLDSGGAGGYAGGQEVGDLGEGPGGGGDAQPSLGGGAG